MTVEKKAPEIRFNGFSEEWQDKEIGSILAETKRPVELLDNELYQLVTVKRRNEGVVPRASLKGKDILVKNYYGIKAGDYLISKRQVVHGANGIVPESLDNAVVSNEYLVLTDSDEITSKFWTVISKRPEMHKLFFISSYGVDIEKLVFDVSDWKNRSITIPDVAEQNAITTHFQKLDSLINQHQQKHDKLSNLKKAMLKKMFPKQGETVPEIRFKEFSREWGSKKLRSVASFHKGKGLPKSSIQGDGIYSCIHYGELFTKYSEVIEMTTSRTNQNDNFFSVSNDVLMPTSDVTPKGLVKPCCIKQNGVVLGGDILVIRPNNQNFIDGAFLSRFIRTREQQVLQNVTGSTVFHLYASSIENLDIAFPSIEEQTAIGNYFQKLDTLINQHQQQITKLTNIKQACLSKMFV
ncbi:restriction endonuclease subunit S [Vibrio splendidus]